jgi:hypothetical protein
MNKTTTSKSCGVLVLHSSMFLIVILLQLKFTGMWHMKSIIMVESNASASCISVIILNYTSHIICDSSKTALESGGSF